MARIGLATPVELTHPARAEGITPIRAQLSKIIFSGRSLSDR